MTTSEEVREARAERLRVKRIKAVDKAIRGRKTPPSTREIAAKTGYSEGLVLSTMRHVNRTTDRVAGTHTGMYVYDQAVDGWKVAGSWRERTAWHATLHMHAMTRTRHLRDEIEVAEALWPKEVPGAVPGTLLRLYEQALDTYGLIAETLSAAARTAAAKSPTISPRRKRVKVHK